jgi:perosamine synthetase
LKAKLKNNQKKIIPYGRHYLDQDDVKAVVDVLNNGWLTQGPKVEEFEHNIAKKVGSNYAVAVSSATAALHLSCLAANLGPGQNAITSANSFVASSNCIEYVGANPFFTDIDPSSLNMCPKDLKSRLDLIRSISVIIPVHFSGVACDMDSISSIAKNNEAIVIEDASHALGGKYLSGENIGCCKYSDMTVFSLHPVKGVTAGEGGVITTNDKSLYTKLMRLRSHGICKGNFDFPGVSVLNDELVHRSEASENGKLNPWYYEMQQLGFNYRITDIQSALASSQLNKLDMFMRRRIEITKIYDDYFKDNKFVQKTQVNTRGISANHLYIIRINFKQIKLTRSKFMNLLKAQGIGSQVHYVPIPMHPYYSSRGFNINDYIETENYYREALSIPIFYGLDDSSVNYVAEKIAEILTLESRK